MHLTIPTTSDHSSSRHVHYASPRANADHASYQRAVTNATGGGGDDHHGTGSSGHEYHWPLAKLLGHIAQQQQQQQQAPALTEAGLLRRLRASVVSEFVASTPAIRARYGGASTASSSTSTSGGGSTGGSTGGSVSMHYHLYSVDLVLDAELR